MGRTIITKADLVNLEATGTEAFSEASPDGPIGAGTRTAKRSGRGAAKADSYLSRLVKYVPAEILCLYLSLAKTAQFSKQYHSVLLWVALGACVILTPIFLHWREDVSKWQQLVLSTGAFIAWALVMPNPTGCPDEIAYFVMVLYTFVVSIFGPQK